MRERGQVEIERNVRSMMQRAEGRGEGNSCEEKEKYKLWEEISRGDQRRVRSEGEREGYGHKATSAQCGFVLLCFQTALGIEMATV